MTKTRVPESERYSLQMGGAALIEHLVHQAAALRKILEITERSHAGQERAYTALSLIHEVAKHGLRRHQQEASAAQEAKLREADAAA